MQTLLEQDEAYHEAPREGLLYLANEYSTASWELFDYVYYAVAQAFEEAADNGKLPDFSGEAFQTFLRTLQSATLST